MAYTELGDDTNLKLKIPTKGTTNWDEELKTNTFQKIVDHDHTGIDGKGGKIDTAALKDSSVTTAKIADDSITSDKKKTYNYTHAVSQNTWADLISLGSNKAFTIDYFVNNGSLYQKGRLEGSVPLAICCHEFVGDDMGFEFRVNVDKIQVQNTTTSTGDKIKYSIELLEINPV